MATTTYRPGAELRPLGLGELIDRTFTLYRNHFWLFCGVMVVPECFSVLVTVLWTLSPAARSFQNMTAKPPADPITALSAMASGFSVLFFVYLAHMLIYVVAIGAVTYVVADVYLRRPASIQTAYQQALRRAGAVIGLCLLLGAIAFVLYLAAAIVGALMGAIVAGVGGAVLGGAVGRVIGPIAAVLLFMTILLGGLALAAWVLLRFAVSMQILLIEERGVFDSLNRSGQLTSGHRWRIFLGVLITALIAVALSAALTMPLIVMTTTHALRSEMIPMWLQLVTAFASGLSGVITGPLLAITMALIYFDLRIRKEGFDIEAAMIQTQTAPIVGGEVAPPAL